MHDEIKRLCTAKEWCQAVESALRLTPDSIPGKIDTLVFIGKTILTQEGESTERDAQLEPIIGAFLQVHDDAHAGPFVAALKNENLRETFSLSIGELLHRRLRLSGEGE